MGDKREFDDLFEFTGQFGTFQLCLCLVLFWGALLGSDSLLQNFVSGSTMGHWCLVPELQNFSHSQQQYIAIPKDSDEEYKSCKKYDLNYTVYSTDDFDNWNRNVMISNDTKTIDCDKWVFDQSEFKATLRSSFTLTCDRGYLVPMPASIYFFGLLFGAYITGELGDRLGRKPVIFACSLVKMVFGIACAFSPYMWFYLSAMFIVGFVSAGSYMTGFILMGEMIGPKYRSAMSMIYQTAFSLGYVLFSGMAYFIRDWRYLTLSVYVLIFPLLLGIWMIPESPRWLIKKNKLDNAEKVLSRVTKINKRDPPEHLSQMIIEIHEEEARLFDENRKQKSCLDLYKSKRLRLWSIAFNYYWFTVSIMYYAMSLSAGALAGSVFLNTALMGLVEIPANFAALLGCDWPRLGRRYTSVWSLAISGFSSFIMVPFILNESEVTVSSLSYFGKAFVTAGFSSIYLFSAEVFPTEIRNAGMGAASLCARIGGILAPWLGAPLAEVWAPLPVILFGVIGTTAGLFLLVVPETLGQPMFQTLEEAEQLGKTKPEEKNVGNSVDVIEAYGKDNLAFVPCVDESPVSEQNKIYPHSYSDESTYL